LRERPDRFVNYQPLQLALRETQQAYRSPRVLIGLAVVALILGYAGPFDTFRQLGVLPRSAYWAIIVFVTYGVGLAAGLTLLAAFHPRPRHLVWRVLVIGISASLPVTPILALINLGFLGGNPFAAPSLLMLWSYCFVVSLGVGVMHELLPPNLALAGTLATAAPAPAAPPTILNRVPLQRRGRLIALSVSDHYVEVLTDGGRSLVLMRLSDAIAETGSVRGLQIHRSHWVALDAVRGVVRNRGTVLVELPGGERLPISRGYLPAARAAGLLA
jgi:LytTr DNA-binding domain